jgi:hypothetical protein
MRSLIALASQVNFTRSDGFTVGEDTHRASSRPVREVNCNSRNKARSGWLPHMAKSKLWELSFVSWLVPC